MVHKELPVYDSLNEWLGSMAGAFVIYLRITYTKLCQGRVPGLFVCLQRPCFDFR